MSFKSVPPSKFDSKFELSDVLDRLFTPIAQLVD